MGGTVAETIRKENGEVIKMARKTGAYNWMFFTKEFCEKQFELAIENHAKPFLEMKKDYENGEPYKFPMSGAYGWCDETSPIAYGLVVIDFQNKKLHSMQGYDTPGEYYLSELSKHVILTPENEAIFDYLIKNNLLNVYPKFGNGEFKTKDIVEMFGKDCTLEKIRNKMDSSFSIITQLLGTKEDLRSYVLYPKALSEFQYLKYDETPNGTLQFFQNLIQDGFVFTEEELNTWKENIKDFDGEYFLEESEYEIEDDKVVDKIIEKRKNIILEKMDSLQNGNVKKVSLKQ